MDDTTKAQLKVHEAYVNYWLAMGITKAGLNRKLFHGLNKNDAYTDQEKTTDCLKTALIHIHRMQELIDKHKEGAYMLTEVS